ncbi:MAG: hypothetical protein KatS3mg004_0161 [Bryobacteraceae bacterium]|nr:MAG: hypothetical protein KatS3mg004_0161 [Bryobacteraceae bacterium]
MRDAPWQCRCDEPAAGIGGAALRHATAGIRRRDCLSSSARPPPVEVWRQQESFSQNPCDPGGRPHVWARLHRTFSSDAVLTSFAFPKGRFFTVHVATSLIRTVQESGSASVPARHGGQNAPGRSRCHRRLACRFLKAVSQLRDAGLPRSSSSAKPCLPGAKKSPPCGASPATTPSRKASTPSWSSSTVKPSASATLKTTGWGSKSSVVK